MGKKLYYDPIEDTFEDTFIGDWVPYKDLATETRRSAAAKVEGGPTPFSPSDFRPTQFVERSDYKKPVDVKIFPPTKKPEFEPHVKMIDYRSGPSFKGAFQIGPAKNKLAAINQDEDFMARKWIRTAFPRDDGGMMDIIMSRLDDTQKITIQTPIPGKPVVSEVMQNETVLREIVFFPVIEAYEGTTLKAFYLASNFYGYPFRSNKGKQNKIAKYKFEDSPWANEYEPEDLVVHEVDYAKPGPAGMGEWGGIALDIQGQTINMRELGPSFYYSYVRELKPMGKDTIDDKFDSTYDSDDDYYPKANFTDFSSCQACFDREGEHCPWVPPFGDVIRGGLWPYGYNPDTDYLYYWGTNWTDRSNQWADTGIRWGCMMDICDSTGGIVQPISGSLHTQSYVEVNAHKTNDIFNQRAERASGEVLKTWPDYTNMETLMDWATACMSPSATGYVRQLTMVGPSPWVMKSADIEGSNKWCFAWAIEDYTGVYTDQGSGGGFYFTNLGEQIGYGGYVFDTWKREHWVTTPDGDYHIFDSNSDDDSWCQEIKIFELSEDSTNPIYIYSMYSHDNALWYYGMIFQGNHHRLEIPLIEEDGSYYHEFAMATYYGPDGESRPFTFPADLYGYRGFGEFRCALNVVLQEHEAWNPDERTFPHERP